MPDKASDVPEVVTHLIRVGFDDIEGYFEDGLDAWENHGYEIGRLETVSIRTFVERLSGGKAFGGMTAWKYAALPMVKRDGALPCTPPLVRGHRQIFKRSIDGFYLSAYPSGMRRPHYEQIARLGQAMASPVRLRALNLLAQREWRVGELAAELGESVAATSAHLKVLRAAGMVVEEKRGREVWCRVESDEVFRLLAAAHRAAETLLPELREAAREADDDPYLLRSVSLPKLAEDAARKRVTLIDLRPREEYRAGHLPRARSYPFPELAVADLKPLQGKKRLVAYCRGPWCVMAREGVKALNERGVPAKRLRLSIVDWRAEGFELVRDESTGTSASSQSQPN